MGLVSFYLSAHQDDWQLFRGEFAWNDLSVGADVVFVYLTAGDAGRTDGWWEARESGALASARLAMDNATNAGGAQEVRSSLLLNGHDIAHAEYGRTRSYFLRLPDGNLSPNGALPQLMANDSPAQTVDGATTYSSANDLISTVRKILERERTRVGMPHPWINAPDFDQGENPGDNPDHWATGEVALAAGAGIYNVAWWVGYDSGNRNTNLDTDSIDRKRWVFATYNSVAIAELGSISDDEYARNYFTYEGWLRKSYARSTPF